MTVPVPCSAGSSLVSVMLLRRLIVVLGVVRAISIAARKSASLETSMASAVGAPISNVNAVPASNARIHRAWPPFAPFGLPPAPPVPAPFARAPPLPLPAAPPQP